MLKEVNSFCCLVHVLVWIEFRQSVNAGKTTSLHESMSSREWFLLFATFLSGHNSTILSWRIVDEWSEFVLLFGARAAVDWIPAIFQCWQSNFSLPIDENRYGVRILIR